MIATYDAVLFTHGHTVQILDINLKKKTFLIVFFSYILIGRICETAKKMKMKMKYLVAGIRCCPGVQ